MADMQKLANEIKALSLADKLRAMASFLDRKRPDLCVMIGQVAKDELTLLELEIDRVKRGGK